MPRAKRETAGPARAAALVEDATAALPALPAWKAFIVQFTRETGVTAGAFAGRVEHLSSGHRERFSSREELLAIMTRQLRALEDRPQ